MACWYVYRLYATCGGWHNNSPGQVGMNDHQAVVDVLVAIGSIGVHYVQLSPQVVPVLFPGVVAFNSANTRQSYNIHGMILLHMYTWF